MKTWSLAGVEVLGQALHSYVDGFQEASTLATRILLNEGIGQPGPDGKVQIDPQAWYPVEKNLKAMHEIGQVVGEIMQYEVGLKAPANAALPPSVTDVHGALRAIDAAYHMNHRKGGKALFDPATGQKRDGGIGHYDYQPIPGKKEGLMVCDSPYPCPFDHGLITAMGRRIQTGVWVFHADGKPCRKNGGDSCTYVIKWA